MRELDLQEFVDEIYEDTQKNSDTKYLFFLGAGCSKSSGIPLASELTEQWYEELKKQKTKFDRFNKEYKIPKSKKSDISKYYFETFETLFPTPLMQQKEIQRITNEDSVNPNLGYYTLATLMQKPQFNTIITTNFDNLIQDALIYSNNKRALVITHQDLAQFIERDDTPLIIKIHGDAHIRPYNNKEDTKNIQESLKNEIQPLFTNVKVIFIGYRGDDESIANLLEGCSRIDQVYWLSSNPPKGVKVSKWWEELSTKSFIKERDFDRIMSVIKSKFSIEAPDFNKLEKTLKDKYDSAMKEEVEEIEEVKDKTYLDYFILGNTYFDQEEYDKAIESYKKAIEINPKKDEAYYNMGIAYGKNEEYDKAIESYKKAVEINPKKDEAYDNMGIAYDKNEDYDKAIESYKKAVEINPKEDNAYYNMGNVYNEKREYNKAIESYKKAIEINPKDEEAYYNMGTAYDKNEEYDKAIEAYKKAVGINPKKDGAYYNMGVVYCKKEEYDKAIELYKKAIEINPEKHAAYTNLFEIQIILDESIDSELMGKYIILFEKEKDKFINYDMLKIVSLINQDKNVDLDKWLEIYKEQSLYDWSFDELARWASTKTTKKKEKLLEAIKVFKTKLNN